MAPDAEIVAAFAPTGTLRASINLGNPILVNRDDPGSRPYGVSIDLADGLAAQLGVDIELVIFVSARESVEAVTDGRADIGFFAVDPKRGEYINFTAPYVLIEGAYLVAEGSPITANEEVDRPGNRVAVGKGSAYDLHLSRTLEHAEIMRATTSPGVVDLFLEQGLEVAAGVKQQLEKDGQRHPGLRLLPGRFMTIRQAMGVHRLRGDAAAAYLREYVEAQKADGFVADAMARHGIEGASVAPAGDMAG